MASMRIGLVVIAAATVSACQRDNSTSDLATGVTRDSAGVQIVEYTALPQAVSQWTVSATPDVDIGTAEGDVHTAFGRVSGFAEGPGGIIVVADRQAQEARAFDESGKYLWTAGRRGSGPGEFTSLGSVFWKGDSLVAVNHFSRAVMLFGSTGAFGRTAQLEQPSRSEFGSPSVQGVLTTGDIVITAAQNFNPAGALGYRRDSFLLQLYGPDGKPRAELGVFPDIEIMYEDMRGRTIARPVEFGRFTVVTARDTTIVAATTDRFEFRKYNAAGGLTQIVRVAVDPQPVNATIRSRYVAHTLSQIDEGDRDAARPMIEATALPDVLGALEDVQIDAAGNVWVKQFAMPDEAESAKWWVFDADGRIIGSAHTPSGLTRVRIGNDHVLGLAFDSLGVAHVRKHRIRRSQE